MPEDLPPFHEGESLIQTRAGVRERMASLGPQVIRSFMPEQHRTFFTRLPFVVVGGIDAAGRPLASLLTNPPGFISSPDPHHLLIRAQPSAADPLHGMLTAGAPIALLGIEQHTRRRNRLNGLVEQTTDEGFLVAARQSYGNCPKYIQARQAEYVRLERVGPVHCAATLNERTRHIVSRADTFFIATAHPGARPDAVRSHGVDVSHRGGKPGFVRVDQDQTLTVPDFVGNHFFNTLGNLVLNPRAGLLFIDFASGDLLHIAVDATLIFEGPELEAFAGAQRLLRLQIQEVRHRVAAVPVRWPSEAQTSPFLANTGCWSPSESARCRLPERKRHGPAPATHSEPCSRESQHPSGSRGPEYRSETDGRGQ